MSSDQRVVLISGGNTGLGFEAAKALVESQERFHVLLGSRTPSKGEQAVRALQGLSTKSQISTVQIDVTSEESIAAAVRTVEGFTQHIDVLVNNAGKISVDTFTQSSLRDVLETNVLGTVGVTEAFKPLLLRAREPRLIIVTSGLGSLTGTSDPKSPYYNSVTGGQYTAYRMSKAALNMAMIQYTKELAPQNVKVWAIDPGPNQTSMMDSLTDDIKAKMGEAEFDELLKKIPLASKGGQLMADVVQGKRDADVGKIVGSYGIGQW